MKFIAAALLMLSLSQAGIAKDCKKGKPCGNSCIAQDKECKLEDTAKKNCKKGKPCGNSCIAKDAVCTK